MKIFKFLTFSFLLISFLSCATNDEDQENNSTIETADGSSVNSPPLSSRCGVVQNGGGAGSVSEGDLEPVSVRVISADEVVVTRLTGDQAGNQQAVKLHGISASSSFQSSRGANLIRQASSPNAFLVTAGCEYTFPSGGRGVFGQLFSASGQNVNEILLEAGAVTPVSQGCGDEGLVGCYSGIEVVEEFSSQTIGRVLWKPVSERDGNLVLLVGNANTTAVVNGVELVNEGFSNGYGSTLRSNRSGASFGGNIEVKFYNRDGLRLRLADGSDSLIVPNGGSRVELSF